MQKRDFIQTAAIEFMPQTGWDVDKTIQYAERLWQRLSEKGYGGPVEGKKKEIPKAYDKLSPTQKKPFDLFWLAFDLKCSKDKAAERWLEFGELSNDEEYGQIIHGAKETAKERKHLPEGQVPKHAQGWLTERRWLAYQKSETEITVKQADQRAQELNKLRGDLAHAKHMAEITKEAFWDSEVERLNTALKQLRDSAHDR